MCELIELTVAKREWWIPKWKCHIRFSLVIL